MPYEGDGECGICLSLVTNNLECPQCAKLFCTTCLQNWMKNAASCPSCRLQGDISKFQQNKEAHLEINSRVVKCEYCDTSFQWENRALHLEGCAKANVRCPFEGCTFKGPENVVDVHTMTCVFGQQYAAMSTVVKQEDVPERYHDLLKDLFHPSEVTEDNTLVHYCAEGDTMAGLCVKYNCSAAAIRRLNKMNGDMLFEHMRLIVPKPANWDAQVGATPHVPIDALIALRKKRLTKEMMYKTGLSAEESVAYLHVVDYNLKAAIGKFESDHKWAEDNDYSKPSSLKEFLKQQTFRQRDFDDSDGAAGGASAKPL